MQTEPAQCRGKSPKPCRFQACHPKLLTIFLCRVSFLVFVPVYSFHCFISSGFAGPFLGRWLFLALAVAQSARVLLVVQGIVVLFFTSTTSCATNAPIFIQIFLPPCA